MLRKIATIFAVVILLPAFLSAQETSVLRPDGKIIKYKGDFRTLEVQSIKEGKSGNLGQQNVINKFSVSPNSPNGTIDTLIVTDTWGTNFGFFGQDWMMQWFKAPSDLDLQFVGFATVENVDAMTVEVKVVTVNWTEDQLLSAAVVNRGYYEATGNGFNDISAFADNPDVTGGWTSLDGESEPFGADIWGDEGSGFQIIPVDGASDEYQWVDLSVLEIPQLLQGDIFGIAIKHTGGDLDQNRLGFWAEVVGVPAWKFYANGRLAADDWGWWTRTYSWDFVAIVDLTGDRAPVINSMTTIPSGPDLGPFTVDANITDDNPGDPPDAGVASTTLWWSNDGGANWNPETMSGSEPNYSSTIPAQSANLTVEYYIEATDVNGLIGTSATKSFFVFGSSGAATLVIYNGLGSVSGYPQEYYWGLDVSFVHDSWAYGELPLSVANNYTNIIEFGNSGPADYNDAAIRDWLAADGSRNYFLTGQEWLGARYGYVDMDFVAGDFEFDILGINHSYNDVSYDGVSGQGIPSLVLPLAGTMFGDPLLDLFNSLDPPADSMMYNPVFEIPMDNWIDAFEVEADVEVDMTVETRGIGGVPDVQTLPTMAHRTLPAGNKIVFVAFDPISLNTANDSDFPYYYWVGWDEANVSYQAAFNWFGIPTGVKEVGGVVPKEFSISQNYPNPFNPSTTIKFSVPEQSNVVLKVYNILGSEVVTLFDGVKSAGNYEVNFDASNLASGMYIYTLRAGNFTTSKKMMLLK